MTEVQKKDLLWLALDSETTSVNPHEATLLGWSSCLQEASRWEKTAKPSLKGVSTVLHNGKYDAIVLKRNMDVDVHIDYDTMLAEYLLHIDRSRKLEEMILRYFGIKKKDLKDLYRDANPTWKGSKELPDRWWEDVYKTTKKDGLKLVHTGVPEAALSEYAKADVKYLERLKDAQLKEFAKRPSLYKWFTEVEMPLCNIITKAELKGIKLDLNKLATARAEVEGKHSVLLKELYWLAGSEVNFNSSPQMQELLFKKMKLKPVRRTKEGWSTDKKTLEKLATKHAFPKRLLQWNELDDLLIKFLNPLPGRVDANGRIHCTFNQALTKTRRFSCEDPNLQQIPAKTELGQRIRECFVPEEGKVFIDADYSQVELRLLAHFSEDPVMMQWFFDGRDIHTATAAMMFNVKDEDVTKAQRTIGKTINFSIIYGKTAFGFAKDWNVSEAEAEETIKKWFQGLKKVRQWMEDTKLTGVRNKGWTKTLAGLPLYVGDEISSSDEWKRAKALRRLINFPIQGSSQDIIKKATVSIYNELNELYPLIWVHDELLFEVEKEQAEELDKRIVQIMTEAFTLKVPLEVDSQISTEWKK